MMIALFIYLVVLPLLWKLADHLRKENEDCLYIGTLHPRIHPPPKEHLLPSEEKDK
jgi:hypothetical protein